MEEGFFNNEYEKRGVWSCLKAFFVKIPRILKTYLVISTRGRNLLKVRSWK